MSLATLRSLWRNLLRKGEIERDLADEVRSYVELSTAQKMKAGLSETEARRAALVEFEGTEQVKEQVREARRGYHFELFLRDLRFAFRTLRKAPAFSLTVALVLALGLGSTVLMFAIVNSVLLKGPPFPEAERLFTLWQRIPQEPRVSFSLYEFVAWQEQTQTFESLAFVTGSGFILSGRGDPELIIGRVATPSLFQVLRAPAALGRVFTEEERDAQVVVLTHALWRDKFNRRPDVLGQAMTLNGQPYTIIGVLPESFELDGPQARLFVPASLASPNFAQNPNAHFLRVVGRLKPETTRAQLEAEIKLLGPRVVAPDDDTDRRFFALSLQELTSGELRAPLLVLLGAVAFFLLIACANVANLMLARSHARQAEMAIRAALGASRPRLIAQLLTESTLLALIGGAAGLALATWGLELLRHFAAADVPELLHAQIDPFTLGFALIAAAGVGICLGLGPALAVGHTSFQGALKGTTRTTAGSERLRQSLVFAEVAIAVVLLVGCALMLRSFSALLGVDPGFRPAGVVIANLFLPEERYADALKMTQFYRASLDAVRRLPGVEASGLVTHLPFGGNSWGNSFAVEGIAAPPPDAEPTAQIRPISPGYFAAMGIPLRAGRDFIAHDDVSSTGVAVVNELFARRFWPNESPLGHRLRYGKAWLEVVGVCGNIKHAGLTAESDLEIYVPYPQVPAEVLGFVGRDLNFVVRSKQPGAISADLRQALRALDPQAVVKITAMDALIHESTAQPRFRTWLIALVSAFALALASLGIYGVVAYLVTQRYREIGLRLALGASRAHILRLILGRTLRLASAGIAAGLLGAFFLMRFLKSVLFGVTTHDSLAFLAVPLLLLAVALLAGYLPARRAMRVDPVTSLRYE